MNRTKRARTLNDIRYFESAYLPDPQQPMPCTYMGRFFTSPSTPGAFSELIGSKCAEAKVTINAGSALYLLFTPAIPAGQIQRLYCPVETWHTWVAFGLNESFNNLNVREQEAAIQHATFQTLHSLAPDFKSELQTLEAEYGKFGQLLRVNRINKIVRDYRIVVSLEIRPRTEVSRLWMEVTILSANTKFQTVITPLAESCDGFFLSQRVTVVGRNIIIHPRQSSRANFYTAKYSPPFQINIDELIAA